MSSIFLPIDIQEAWAPENKQTTAAIAAAVNDMRNYMQVMWVMINMGPASRQGPYRANTDCLTNAFYKYAGHNPLSLTPSEEKDIVVAKAADSIAHNPQVIPFLKRNEVDTVYLAGFQTNRCVLKSAKDLAAEFNVILFSDLTADKGDMVNNGYEQKFKDIGAEVTSFKEFKGQIGHSL